MPKIFPMMTKLLMENGVQQVGNITTDNVYNSYNYFVNTYTMSEFRSRYPDIQFGALGLDFTNIAKYVYNNNITTPQVAYTLKNGAKITAYRDGNVNGSVAIGYYDTNGNLGAQRVGLYGISDAINSGRVILASAIMFLRRDDNSLGYGVVTLSRTGTTDYVSLAWEFGSYIQNWVNGILVAQPPVPDDPYGLNENDTPTGGYGPFDYTSETELPPSLPSISAAQVGFVSLWNPSQSEMKDLANYLWTGTFDLTNFKKLFADPMECVLSVGIIPITPTRKQSGGMDVKEEIVFGGSSHSGVNAYPVTEQFYIADMGTLHINGLSKSAMDYSPYCKASIYLPYCGTYALDVDEIMDSDIALEYHIDIYTGACVAYLTIDEHINSDGHTLNAVMYQFTGNVLASIPINGNDHSQFIQSMLFMGAAAAATVATGGAGAAAAGADLSAEVAATGFNKALAGSAINTVMSMKPNVQHSGNLSTTAGLLGGQKPFITMTWSNLCRPDDEYKLVGMPLHKSGTLSDFEGFTIVSACHLDNILCTDAELQMIEQALAKGVIL